MAYLVLPMVAFVICVQGASSASITLYETTTEEDIRNNIIGLENDSVKGLTPQDSEVENHFTLESSSSGEKLENPYVVEVHGRYIAIKTSGFPSQKIKLNETETEGIQKMALSFIELLNSSKLSPENSEKDTPDWKELNPVITIANTEISVRFLNTSDTEPNAKEVSPGNKRILWDFLTKYVRNIFEEKLKQQGIREKYAEVFVFPVDQTNSFPFQNFLDFMWSIMRVTVDYAEVIIRDWTTSEPDTPSTEIETKTRPSTATLFAYEELSPFHEFPSQEFQYRRKDIDSIFYGRGVI